MRIAYVYDVIYPYIKGGAQKRIWELSKRLATRGHEVTVFGMKHWEGPAIISRERVRLYGVCSPQKLYVNGHRSVKEAVYFSGAVLPHLLKNEFDIIDCQNFPYFSCFSSKVASVLKGFPLLITWHEVWDSYWSEYLGKIGVFGKIVERLTTKLAKVNMTGTRYNMGRLVSLGINEDKIKLIPIGGISFSDIERIPSAAESVDVIFVGRLTKAKGVETLLHSLAYLRSRSSSVQLAIVGDGPERENLQALARRLDIYSLVRFMGNIEDDARVLSIMKSARVFVYPAAPEGGWSLSVVEANACGLPAISTRSGLLGDNEVVIDGYNGLLTEEESAEAIAEKIRLLLEHEPLRQELSRNALNFAKGQDWGNLATKMEDLYGQVARKGS
jgi:glycosyltransferase involved in cell wall biosynthesis